MIMITIMMLQLRYAQPCICMNDLPGEVAVTMIGNTNSTVHSIVSFKILTIQVVIFVEVVNCLKE